MGAARRTQFWVRFRSPAMKIGAAWRTQFWVGILSWLARFARHALLRLASTEIASRSRPWRPSFTASATVRPAVQARAIFCHSFVVLRVILIARPDVGCARPHLNFCGPRCKS